MTPSPVTPRLWSGVRAGGADWRFRPKIHEASEWECGEEQLLEH